MQKVNEAMEEGRKTSKEKVVLQHQHGHGVVQVTLNRPKALNAFNAGLYRESARIINKLSHDTTTRVIIITGSGTGSFCAGMDVKEGSDERKMQETMQMARRLMRAVMECKKVLVCVCFGKVMGIGVTLLMHCDAVYAEKGSVFGTPFVGVGVVPEFGSSILFPRALGKRLTERLLIRGKAVTAAEMEGMGICEAVEGALGRAIMEWERWSEGIGKDEWKGVLAAKRVLKMGMEKELQVALDREFGEMHTLVEEGSTGRLMRKAAGGRGESRLARL